MQEVEVKCWVFRSAHHYIKLLCEELSSILSYFWGAKNKLTHN